MRVYAVNDLTEWLNKSGLSVLLADSRFRGNDGSGAKRDILTQTPSTFALKTVYSPPLSSKDRLEFYGKENTVIRLPS